MSGIVVRHAFETVIADDPAAQAAGQVLPSHWNADHVITGLTAADVGIISGSVSISPAGLYAKEQSTVVAGVLTTSKIIVAVSGAMTYPDELELAPAYAFARCVADGTLLTRLVCADKMHATYSVTYQILN